MATRYWVGGTGTWNTSSTTNWSATSGGGGGSSAPTVADTVIVDLNSGTGTITLSGTVSCAAFYWGNGSSSNITTITGGTSLTVAGTFAVDQNSTAYFFTIGSLILTGTGNFSSNIPNVSLSNFTAPITINGSGITVTTAGSGFNSTAGSLTLTQGTLALGSIGISAASFNSSNTNTRGVTWGTGSIGIAGSGTLWNTATSTGFTSTGTSKIVIGGSSTFSISPGSLILNYTVNGASGSTIALAGLTVNNFTINTLGSATNSSGTFTVNGNLSLTGTGTFGGIGNLSVGGTLTATGTGTFANSGTNSIAGSGATVLSFPSTYSFSGSYSFNLTYSGSTGTRTVSLPYSSTVANIPSLNVSAGSDTVSFGNTTTNYLTNLSFSGFTGTASGSAALVLYGNLTLGSSTTFSLSGGISLSGSGTQTITTNGRTISTNVTQNGSGTVSLSGNMTLNNSGNAVYTLTSGFLSLSTSTLSTNQFNTSGATSRTLQFGTGNITLTGGLASTIWSSATTTNFLYTGTSTINVNPSANASYTISTGTLTETQSMNFVFGSGTYTISDSNAVYKNFDATSSGGSFSGSSRTIYGNITTGASVVSLLGTTTFASTISGQTITTNGIAFPDLVQNTGAGVSLTLNDNLTTTSFTFTQATLSLNNKTLSTTNFTSNNSNTRAIQFGTSGNITITGSSGFSMSTNTGFTYSGTSAINISAGTLGVFINTGTPSQSQALNFNFFGSGTMSETGSPIYNNLNLASFTGIWPNNARSLYGNLTLSSSVTYSAGSNATSFINTSTTQIITANGATLNNPINHGAIFGTSASIQLADNLTLGSSYAYNLYGGALDLNNKTLSTGIFFSNSVNTRSIAFGTTGNITTTGGSSATVWDISTATGFSYTGASNALINMNSVTISPGPQSSSTAVNFHFQGTGGITINAGSVKDLDFSLVSTGSLYTSSGTVTMYGNLTFSPTMTFAGGPSIIAFAATSGTQKITTYNNPYFVSYTQYQQTGSGGTVQLQDNLIGYTYSLLAGTFDANNYNVTLAGFTSTTTTNSRSILMGSGAWTLGNGSIGTAQWSVASTNLSLTKGTANIVMNPFAGTSPTFDGGDFTYNNITLNLLGNTTTTFSGNNTFATFTCSPTTANNNLTFTSGSTTTVTGWAVNGSAGNLLGLNATTLGSQATLSKASGTVTSYFLNLQDSNATGGATWIASNSVNLGNNTGWYLPNGNNNIFLLFS